MDVHYAFSLCMSSHLGLFLFRICKDAVVIILLKFVIELVIFKTLLYADFITFYIHDITLNILRSCQYINSKETWIR